MQESWRAGPGVPGHPTSQAGACQCNLYFYWFANEIPPSYWLQIRDSSTLIGRRPRSSYWFGFRRLFVSEGFNSTIVLFQLSRSVIFHLGTAFGLIPLLSNNFDYWIRGIGGMAKFMEGLHMYFSQWYWQFAEHLFHQRILAVCWTCTVFKDIGSLLNMYFSQWYWQFAEQKAKDIGIFLHMYGI